MPGHTKYVGLDLLCYVVEDTHSDLMLSFITLVLTMGLIH